MKNITHWIDKIRWNDKTRWTNETRYTYKIKWKNVTNYKIINITREITIEIPYNTTCKNITIYINKTGKITKDIIETNDNSNSQVINFESSRMNNNSTQDCGNNTTNRIFQIGFFITLAMTLLCFLMIAWKCGLKDLLEEFIDDMCFCGCRDNLQMCKTICGICRECCDENDNEPIHNTKPHPQNAPRIEMKIMERVEVDEITGENRIVKRLQV